METDPTSLPPSPFTIKEDPLEINNSFPEHGNEVLEVISNKPPYIVRWGTLYFFLLLVFIAIVSWFIKYPDIVIAQAELKSVNPPQQVLARTSGKLTRILIGENQNVKKGEMLGFMESIAQPESVLTLGKKLDSISELISHN